MVCYHLQTVTLRQGDSSDFFYNINIPITIEEGSTVDLTGWKAILQIGDYTETYNDITSKELEIIISAEASRYIPLGTHTAYLKFITSDNKVGTMRPLFILEILGEAVYDR